VPTAWTKQTLIRTIIKLYKDYWKNIYNIYLVADKTDNNNPNSYTAVIAVRRKRKSLVLVAVNRLNTQGYIEGKGGTASGVVTCDQLVESMINGYKAVTDTPKVFFWEGTSLVFYCLE